MDDSDKSDIWTCHTLLERFWNHALSNQSEHDDVIKWKHFHRCRSLVRVNHRLPLMFPLICAWTNSSVNNRDAGYVKRHRAHYVVLIIKCEPWISLLLPKCGIWKLWYQFRGAKFNMVRRYHDINKIIGSLFIQINKHDMLNGLCHKFDHSYSSYKSYIIINVRIIQDGNVYWVCAGKSG